MDLNLWSFILSIVGVLLGIISAFAQIKAVSQKAFRATGDALARSMEVRNAQADFFIAYPSALLAYALRNLLITAMLLCIGVVLLKYRVVETPLWLHDGLGFVLGGICSNLITYVVLVSRQVYRRALARHSSDGGS